MRKKRKLSNFLISFGSSLLANYIRFVYATSHVITDPENAEAEMCSRAPVIMGLWHGQFLMMPKIKPDHQPVNIMVARHGDAELIGRTLQKFDMGLVRGAGAGLRRKNRGGATALRESLTCLEEGISVGMTADVPPGPARICGDGIVTMAKLSGRPIVPAAVASRQFLTLNTWSRLTVNLPFSKLVFAVGEPIYVPVDADSDTCANYRLQTEQSMNEVTKRAYALAGGNYYNAIPASALDVTDNVPDPLSLKCYRALTRLAQPVAPVIFSYRVKKGKEDLARKHERFGQTQVPRPDGSLIWLHAASVGETNAILPLIEKLNEQYPQLHFLLTTGTITSAEIAQKRLPENAIHQYIPFDAPQYVDLFLEHWKPDLALFVESEIWPNLIWQTREMGIQMVLLNARISKKSFRKWRKNIKLAYALFGCFHLILAQNRKLAQNFRFLGGRHVVASGNLKIDAPVPQVHQIDLQNLQQACQNRPILLAASTHPGEEEIIAKAHHLLKKDFPDILTIVAPRHPHRAEDIEHILNSEKLEFCKRSEKDLPSSSIDVYLADTIGDLGTLFALSPISFMGGSLVPHGGQNPIEAVRLGSVVLTGKHTHNFQDAYRELFQREGACRVTSANDIANIFHTLITDPEKLESMQQNATKAVDELSGALSQTLDTLDPYLPLHNRLPPHNHDPELKRAS
ncbi:MAG: glycosyltransferase N-terminal domain-containing protein [Pseudomonadota bacterium]